MMGSMLKTVEMIGIYPVISMLIFMSVFAVIIYRIVKMDKGHRKFMCAMPLEASDAVSEGREEQNG